MTTLADAKETHPAALVTVYVYVPVPTPVKVELVPVPVVIITPGVLVKVQVPDAGKPFNTTLPVASAHVGWVIVPTVGAVGVTGCALRTTLADAGDVHPTEFVTVKEYVPAARPDRVLLKPEPSIPPGLIVQFPAGKLLNVTLPVATAQVGCVIIPTTGTEGVTGCVLITKLAETKEVHPAALVTIYAYVPATKPVIIVLVPVPDFAPGLIVQFPDAGKPFNTMLPVATAQVG